MRTLSRTNKHTHVSNPKLEHPTGHGGAGRCGMVGRGWAGRKLGGAVRPGNDLSFFRIQCAGAKYPGRFFGGTGVLPVESKTQTYCGRVGAGRCTAVWQGGARQGRTGCRRVGAPRKQPTPSSQGIEDNCLKVSSEARTIEILCKPMEERNERLTGI